ncbi:MAG TPA: cholesterol catabolism transcriptional regulator KstR [Jatrophihabitantaceae bacterium]|nr:cholesterol catabolism transcriptional regulator KstR [Jatrophihabitantaceae bacterium]
MAAPRTKPTNGSALPADELGSSAQRDRRKRILDATLALASKGGYDAVQMRTVAERADVALGTLYRYFPSKIHLLVSAMARELERVRERTARTDIPGDTPFDRLMFILSRITKGMQRDPQLTEAMTRAFMFADASAAAEVDTVGRLMDAMIARAMTDEEPNEEQLAIARVISDVWLSNLVAWVTRRASATDVANRLELTISLLLGHKNASDAF